MVEWTEVSSEVLDIAQELIHDHHPHLREAVIGFLFRSEASVSKGSIVLAQPSKVDAKTQALLESHGAVPFDFLIWIAKDEYDRLSLEQRQALVDHQLCHCVQGDNGFAIRGHDFEEFQSIVDRYGFWNYSLLNASNAFKKAVQLDLSLNPEIAPLKGKIVSVQPDTMSVESIIA